jgi:membrane-associated phospholipid phosphatase
VQWHPAWAKFRPIQYGTTVALIAGSVAIVLLAPDPDPRWDGALPFDGAASTVLRGGDGKARERAQYWSDRLHEANFIIGVSEAPIAAMAHGSWDVAWQLSWINAQSYALAGVIQLGTARIVGRVRPFVNHCKDEGAEGEGDEFPCKAGGTTLSFISGHAMTSFVSAGLMCAHHGRLPLYGGGWGDTAACVGMLLSATATGTLRVVADKHYFSDVLIGSILGFAIGYGMPKLLHYGNWNEVKKTEKPKAFYPLVPLPYVAENRAGISWTAMF